MCTNPIPLPPPENPEWGRVYPRDRAEDGIWEANPNAACWRAPGRHLFRFHVDFYQSAPDGTNARKLCGSDCEFYAVSGFINYSSDLLTVIPEYSVPQPGSYFFTVKALGDGTRFADSEEVRSPMRHHALPDNLLPPVTGAAWVWPSIRLPEPVNHPFFQAYAVQVFYAEPETPAKAGFLFGGDRFQCGAGGLIALPYLNNPPADKRAGKYYFKIRAVSKDPAQCGHSPWSPLSAGFGPIR